MTYRFPVVAAGLQLNWRKVTGLCEALGKSGVTSNYSFRFAPYTWECIRNFKGGNALFTETRAVATAWRSRSLLQ